MSKILKIELRLSANITLSTKIANPITLLELHSFAKSDIADTEYLPKYGVACLASLGRQVQ